VRERISVLLAFILIFAFSSVDNAVSPMVGRIAQTYGVGLEKVLWLISACTAGTVLGVFLGPWFTSRLRPGGLLAAASAAMALAQAGFLLGDNFALGAALRAISGFSSGVIAACMWRLTFHGVSKKYYPAMVAVLMSARPLATAIGVPLAGLAGAQFYWQAPLWVMAGAVLAAGISLGLAYPEEADPPPTNNGLFSAYASVLKAPYAKAYYAGFTINRMCYFGFYAIAGIWFIKHYGLSLKALSFALLIIGLAEALINFTAAKIIRRFGQKRTLEFSLSVSFISLLAFVWGGLPLKAAVALITVFMLLDRIYSMALVLSIPQMFPQTGDKTAFGSLNTLTSWAGLTIIAWLAGLFAGDNGLLVTEILLVLSFAAGAAMLYFVQKRTVLTAHT